MTQQLFIWFAVVAVMALAFVGVGLKKLNAFGRLRRMVCEYVHFGVEDEMFYCPGDRIKNEDKL